MITNNNEATVTLARLSELRSRYDAIQSDAAKNERAKKMELAGIQSVVEQMQSELQAYQISELEKSVHNLQNKLRSTETVDIKSALSETLNVIEQLLKIMRPLEKAN